MWSFLKISLIVAMDKKRVIGKDNDIPWRISSDWEYVKNTTKGHAIILGRKNLQSIERALPDRRNIILTRDKNFNFKDCEIAHSIEAAFKLCENEEERSEEHTSELQSRGHLVCRRLLEKKKNR